MKCLEPNPDNRYQRARELLSDLEQMSLKEKRYKRLVTESEDYYRFCGMPDAAL